MTFTIDTGATDRPISFGFGNSALLDGVLDSLPENASQDEIDRALAIEIRRDIGKPRTAKTVRAHFSMHWHLIAPLADRSPTLFDAIIEELHEQLIEKA
jgi:hypothetical protein